MARRTLCLALLAAMGLGLLAQPALAADDLRTLGESPRVFSIQPRPTRLGHEFQLGLGILPTDAFYVGAVVAAAYTYHFTDFWGWEIASAGYSKNFDTSLRGELLEDYEVEPVQGGGERISLLATTGLVVKPLFGKLAIFNESLVHSETFFTVGMGAIKKGKYGRFTSVLGMGLRFWTTEILSFRFDIRDYLIFSSLVPENALFLMLSASLNVRNSSAEAK